MKTRRLKENPKQVSAQKALMSLVQEFSAIRTTFENIPVEARETNLAGLKQIASKVMKIQAQLAALIPELLSLRTLRAQAMKLMVSLQRVLGDICSWIDLQKSTLCYAGAFQGFINHSADLITVLDPVFELDLFRIFVMTKESLENGWLAEDMMLSSFVLVYDFASRFTLIPLKLELFSLCLPPVILISTDQNHIRGLLENYDDFFQNIATKYQETASQPAQEAKIQLAFVQANFTSCHLKTTVARLKTTSTERGLDIGKAIASKNTESLKVYFKIFTDNCRKFMLPGIEAMEHIPDVKASNHNVEWTQIKKGFYQFNSHLEWLIKFYHSLPDDGYRLCKRVIAKDLVFLNSLFSRMSEFFTNKLIEKIHPAFHQHIKDISALIEPVIKKEAERNAAKKQEEREKLDFCMKFELELDEKRRQESLNAQKIVVKTDSEESFEAGDEEGSEEEMPVNQNGEIASLFQQAWALMVAKKNIEAMLLFIEIRYKARAAADVEHEMQAIDALIHLVAQHLLKQLDQISSLLGARLKNDCFIAEEILVYLDSLMQQSFKKITYLEGLYKDLTDLSCEANALHFILSVFGRIRKKNEELLHLHQALMLQKQQNIKKHYIRLGIDVAQSDAHPEEYLVTLGRQESKRLHAESGEKGFFYHENQLVGNRFPDFLNKMQAQCLALENAASQDRYREVRLSESIMGFFQFLNGLSEEHYLTGSAVIQLIEPEFSAHDLDFISATASKKDLISAGLREIRLPEGQVYTGNYGSHLIDILVVENEEPWLRNSLKTRNFTICALSCDSFGRVMDSTGLGFGDLKGRLLRMIGDPFARLEKSPIIALDAIKYKMKGFHLETHLNTAIRSLKIGPQGNLDHFYADIGDYLNRKNTNKIEYLKCLYDCHLFLKIFPAIKSPAVNWNKTLTTVESFLRNKKQNRFGSQNLFYHPQNKATESEKPVLTSTPSSTSN